MRYYCKIWTGIIRVNLEENGDIFLPFCENDMQIFIVWIYHKIKIIQFTLLKYAVTYCIPVQPNAHSINVYSLHTRTTYTSKKFVSRLCVIKASVCEDVLLSKFSHRWDNIHKATMFDIKNIVGTRSCCDMSRSLHTFIFHSSEFILTD